ncbi:hypothetical protein [Cytobacillus oceanisediminis]|uniref:hypothetical protein n=1 Tax=Cytobacillus oceanisediminis TaxID=665099 RepID=UPI002079BA24|nr:hypothetical protein [Cytobacillus oceanisediminis]USK42709.1 hypothetical protein LIT27_19065 [Cytobacillus oceanisediminis]
MQRALPEIVKIANDSVVQEHIEEHSSLIAKKRDQSESSMEIWAASPKREIQQTR